MARKTLLPLLIVLVLGAAALLVWRAVGASGASSDPAPARTAAGPDATPVYAQTIEPERLVEEVTATGVLRADEAIMITSEISAVVIALEFQEGAPVEADALLVKLDDREIRAQLAQAQHRVALAQLQAERLRELVAGQGASQQQYDEALNELRVFEDEVRLLEVRLSKTELRAPFAGTIGLRYVSVGSLVDPATRIVSLQKLDQLKVDFAIPERHMNSATPGRPVTVTVAGRDEPLDGEVYAVEPQIDAATRTVPLRARIRNPGQVLPGAFATVRMQLREVSDALFVPATAVMPGLNEQRVFTIVDGKAESREVETGIRQSRRVQIVQGLDPGDVVITSGQMQLQPGTRVRPLRREEEPTSDRPDTEPARD